MKRRDENVGIVSEIVVDDEKKKKFRISCVEKMRFIERLMCRIVVILVNLKKVKFVCVLIY